MEKDFVKLDYIDIDELSKQYQNIDSDDIFEIDVLIDAIVKEYKGIKFNDTLYKFNINRFCDLLFDISEDTIQGDVRIVYVDKNYVRLIADIIKYMNNKNQERTDCAYSSSTGNGVWYGLVIAGINDIHNDYSAPVVSDDIAGVIYFAVVQYILYIYYR